jgi:drug/metabolite transporter (DMT)-like permease
VSWLDRQARCAGLFIVIPCQGGFINMPDKRFKLGIAALTASTLIWGPTFIVTKGLLGQAGPMTILTLRFFVALCVLLPLAWRQGFRLGLIVKPLFIFSGLTGLVFSFGLQNIGLQYTSAGTGALLDASMPVMTLILSAIFLKEKISPKRILGVGLSVLGIIILTQPKATPGGSMVAWGNLILLVSVVGWAINTIISKKLVAEYSSLVTTTGGFLVGWIMLLPFSTAEIVRAGLPHLTWLAWLGILYLGLLASALTFVMWNFGLQQVDASVAAPYSNLIPVVGLAAATIGGEPASWLQIIGGGLAILGVWICN